MNVFDIVKIKHRIDVKAEDRHNKKFNVFFYFINYFDQYNNYYL